MDEDTLADVQVIVSELVTNAIRFGQRLGCQTLTGRTGRIVRASVTTPAPGPGS